MPSIDDELEQHITIVPSRAEMVVGNPIRVGGEIKWVCIGKIRMRLPVLGEDGDEIEPTEEDPSEDVGTQTICVCTGFGSSPEAAEREVRKQLRTIISDSASKSDVLRRLSTIPPAPKLPAKGSAASNWFEALLQKLR